MYAQNCLFLALECSNRAQSDLDKLMEALFFIRCLGPGLEAVGRCTALAQRAGSPAPALAPSPAGGMGGSLAWQAPFSQLLAQEVLVLAALLNSSPLV